MPAGLQEALFRLAEDSAITVTDLGAYYLIRGWNTVRAEQGLDPIPMPSYLTEAVRRHEDAEVQNVLEESLLKAG